MIADLVFVLGASFILGITTKFYFDFWFLINFLLAFLFYLKTKNLKVSLLILLFLFAGSLFYLLRADFELNLSSPEFISQYRNFLERKTSSSLPFPEENLYRSLLFGSKFEDKNLKENFAQSGLLHLTAVSGQNLTIMFSLVYEFLKTIPLITPNLVFTFSTFFIIFFILIMGFQGNVLRAGIMGFILILVKSKFGRIPLKRNVLILTLLVFAFLDPDFLLKDVGTQLSFLAMTGILYLSPIFEKKFEFIKNKSFKRIASETLSAQIFTLPLILYYFGNFNLFSLFANLLVVPLIPYFMQLASLFLFIPLDFLTWPTLPILKYIIFIAEVFSQFNFYFKIPLILVLGIYVYLFFEIYQKLKNESLDFRFNFS